MIFGQLTEYSKVNIFCRNYEGNEVGTLVPALFSCFKKALCKDKT